MRAFAELVTIGRLVRPQGRAGELVAEPVSDRPDRFPSLRRVLVESAGGGAVEMKVAGCRPHKRRFVLKLEGVDTIEAAERLRDRRLALAEEELEPLPAGSFYHHQLRGLRVLDRAGRCLGSVRQVVETGAVPVLEIAGEGGELLIPLAEPFVAAVDLRAGTLTANAPEPEGAPR